jgi:hypothetical protein
VAVIDHFGDGHPDFWIADGTDVEAVFHGGVSDS